MRNTIDILGIPVDNITMAEAVAKICAFIQEGGTHSVYTPNSEIMMAALRDPELRDILANADMLTADGAGVVLASRILKTPLPEKVSGVDLIREIFEVSAGSNFCSRGDVHSEGDICAYEDAHANGGIHKDRDINADGDICADESICTDGSTHSNSDIHTDGNVNKNSSICDDRDIYEDGALRCYLFGAKPGVAEKAAANISTDYPEVHVVGYRDGYFSDSQNDEIIDAINASCPDILVVGLGAPKQEKWIAANRDRLTAKVCLGLGGTIDILAGVAPLAPDIFRRNGLEWLYRLCREPRRGIRMLDLPRFMLRVLLARLNMKRGKK